MTKVSFASIALLFGLSAFAQEYRGTLLGVVTDSSGSAVAAAVVAVVNVDTEARSTTKTGTEGSFLVPFLKPGPYRLFVEQTGFKRFERSPITVRVNDHVRVDVTLEVGPVREQVSVSDAAPLIESGTASVGETVTTQEVEELPVNGRSPFTLSGLALGVMSTIEPTQIRPFDNGNSSSFAMAGAPSAANELLLNGTPDNTWNKRLAYSPPQDAVTEVRVQSFESDAAYGHTGGGTVNVYTKSGTNALHGSAYEFNQVSFLSANSFFANKGGAPRSVNRINQFGFTSGGPVWVPKVFDGRNKVFWFFAYEGLRDAFPQNSSTINGATTVTVPTAAERQGDFSALLQANKPGTDYTIYNPFSGVQQGSRTARTPFPNNVIPSSLINSVARNYLGFYPLPNTQGRNDGYQNYLVTNPVTDTYSNELARADINLSNKHKLSFDLRHNYLQQKLQVYFPNDSFGDYLRRTNWGTSVDEVYTLSPTTFLDIRGNWTRFREAKTPPSEGFDSAMLGFPSSMAASSQFPGMPWLQFGSGCQGTAPSSFQCLGVDPSSAINSFDAFQLFGVVVKNHGNHSIKAGGDVRAYRLSAFTLGNSAGNFTFSTNWTKGPLDNSAASPFGQDFASFLLGLPTSGSFDVNAHSTQGMKYGAAFIQDDWRVRGDLTLNFGLRWEHETAVSERFNRTANGFDPVLISPISAAATAAYAQRPITQVPASQFQARGGLTFATPASPAAYGTMSNVFSPRAGFAWVPRVLGPGTVIRGGFGVFVTPIAISNGRALNQEGFSQSTQFVATDNNYLSPSATLSNPFPKGILLPAGGGVGTFLGQQVTFYNPQIRNPYSLRWNFGIQRQLPKQFVLEVVYIGNHTVRLFVGTQNLNYIPRQYLSTSPARDTAVINFLSGSVANPFQGLLPNSASLNGSTVALNQLLVPFPQFPAGTGVVLQDANAGGSYFHSLNVRLQKRLTQGLTLINNFTYSKLIERTAYLNDQDTAPEKRVSADSRPLRESLALTYQLPVGLHQKLKPSSRVVNALVGDWSMNAVITLQSGPPLTWGTDMIYYGGPLHWNSHQPDGLAFDTGQFNTASSQQLANHIRTFNTQFNNLRRDPTENLDLSLMKKFVLAEKSYLQLRFESFNTTNRVTFSAPQLTPTSSAFGTISAQANNPRKIQIGARLVW